MRALRVGVQVIYEDRNRLGGMPRGLEHLEADPSNGYPVAIREWRELIFGVSTTAEVDPGALPIAQLEMPGDEVGVEMSKEHVPDPAAEPVGILNVFVNITLRVDHRGDATTLVSHQIRGMRQAPKVVLPQDQCRPPPCLSSRISK
jgi:hypothetical protein